MYCDAKFGYWSLFRTPLIRR